MTLHEFQINLLRIVCEKNRAEITSDLQCILKCPDHFQFLQAIHQIVQASQGESMLQSLCNSSFRSSSLEQTMIEQLRKDLELKNQKILSMEQTIHSLKNKLID